MGEAIIANAARCAKQGRTLVAHNEVGLTQCLEIDPAELEVKKQEWGKLKAERDA